MYKEELANFRNSALPRQFSKTFNENPEPTTIRDALFDISQRYSATKSSAADLALHLRDLVDKHRKFGDAIEVLLPWLEAAEKRLADVLRKKSGNESDTVAIKERISELQVQWITFLFLFDLLFSNDKEIHIMTKSNTGDWIQM